ncbi:MAG: zinc ribbon domain-containing protein [Dissulfuribacterales bacterium]
MKQITRDQIELLIELQKKEVEADRIQYELDKQPAKLAQITLVLKKFEEEIEKQTAALEDLKKEYRSFDDVIADNQARIKKREEQLRAITTNKEYQAILKEIAEIKKTNSRIEDETIECLDKIDAAEKAVKEHEKNYAIEKENINQQKTDLELEADAQRKLLDGLLSEKSILVEQIDPELMKQYIFIKSQARGIAIVEVKEAVCLGCNMNIPPQMYNELHRENELRICPHCHRMLYVI